MNCICRKLQWYISLSDYWLQASIPRTLIYNSRITYDLWGRIISLTTIIPLCPVLLNIVRQTKLLLYRYSLLCCPCALNLRYRNYTALYYRMIYQWIILQIQYFKRKNIPKYFMFIFIIIRGPLEKSVQRFFKNSRNWSKFLNSICQNVQSIFLYRCCFFNFLLSRNF